MKLNRLLFKFKRPSDRYKIIVIDENNNILCEEWCAFRLPSPSTNYKVLSIEAVHEENALPDFATYVKIVCRKVFK